MRSEEDSLLIYEACIKCCKSQRIFDEDFIHDMYVLIERKIDDFYAGELTSPSLYNWIYTVVRREYINLVKKIKNSQLVRADLAWFYNVDELGLERKGREEFLYNKIDELIEDYPIHYRLVVERKMKGMTLKEIAKDCGFLFDNTANYYKEVKRKLKKDLSKCLRKKYQFS